MTTNEELKAPEHEHEQQQQQQKSKHEPVYYRYEVTTGRMSERTKYIYTYNINEFLKHFKVIDLQLLQEYSPKIIKQMVTDYVLFLRDNKKLSHSSISLYVSALAHFFHKIRDDDYKIDWSKSREEIPPDENNHTDRTYTIEEIQKMLSICHRTRDKVIIHLLQSTGMRIGAIHSIRLEDLTPKPTNQGKIYKIEVYAGSSDSYYTFCNLETARIIDEYLKERTDASESMKNDTPLIRNLYDSLNAKTAKPVSHAMIKYIVDRIIKLSGIKNTFQFTGEVMCSHAYRKGFKSVCEQSGMKSINVEMLLGHDIGLGNNYYRPAESDILEDYMSHAANALTISQESRLKQQVHEMSREREILTANIDTKIHEQIQEALKKYGVSKD